MPVVSPKQHGIVLVLMHHTILLYCPSTLYVAVLSFLLFYRNCKDLLSTGGLLKINPWATAPLHSIATAWVSDYDAHWRRLVKNTGEGESKHWGENGVNN